MGIFNFKVCGTSMLCAVLSIPCVAGTTESPYAGQENREIKALSKEDVRAYLAGQGMGLAKAAELNGYPGPAHVLSSAEALALTAQQREQTQALHKTMEAKAIALGRSLVEQERQLDLAFANKTVTRSSLEQMLGQIAVVQAQLRQAHLEAHLEQVKILTPVQVAAYNRLRGYDGSSGAAAHTGHAH